MTQTTVDVATIHPAIAQLTERRNKLDSAIKSIEGLLANASGESFVDAAINAIVDSCTEQAKQQKIFAGPSGSPIDTSLMKSAVALPKQIQHRAKSTRKKAKANRAPREGSKQQAVLEAAEKFLAKKKSPVKLADLHAGVVASGVDVEIKHFSTILTKAENLVNERGVGWRLK